MAKRKFHMKQANTKNKNWKGFSFRSHINDKKPFSCPLISSVCGDDIDYGKLFAYCFRRFGYPERGWDDYKELVTYYLTTSNPDMILNITPYVGNSSVVTFNFMVTNEVSEPIEHYARRDRRAWQERSYNWLEKQGLPEWMSDWVDIYNSEYCADNPEIPLAENWRQAIDFWMPFGEEGSRPYELTNRIVEFNNKLHEDYCKIEPYPEYFSRHSNIEEWDDDDPLKPLAKAAIEALEDLRTPVGVRDMDINAFGEVDFGNYSVKASPSAGYPSGAIGNKANEEFANLHGLILELGKGNAKRGIKKIMAAVAQSNS